MREQGYGSERSPRRCAGLGLAGREAAEQPVCHGEESELSFPTSSRPLRGSKRGDGETALCVCADTTPRTGRSVLRPSPALSAHGFMGLVSYQSRLQMGQACPLRNGGSRRQGCHASGGGESLPPWDYGPSPWDLDGGSGGLVGMSVSRQTSADFKGREMQGFWPTEASGAQRGRRASQSQS